MNCQAVARTGQQSVSAQANFAPAKLSVAAVAQIVCTCPLEYLLLGRH
jgi:hypothetical protein